jgi:hypothetical protein
MTTICSFILAFMLSLGGGVNLNVHLSEKPHPGLKVETRELHPVQTELKQEKNPVLRLFIGNSRLVDRFLQGDPKGYQDSQNLYQGFNMNPMNYTDPMGTIANPEINPLVAQRAYIMFRYYYGSHVEAMKMMYQYKYAIRSGVNDTIRQEDEVYENMLSQSYFYEPFDTTPRQFAKDAVAGTTNVGFEMMSWGFKIMSMGDPKACEKIDKVKEKIQGGVNKLIGARKGSIGYYTGTFYGPAFGGGISAGYKTSASMSQYTDDMLPFLDDVPKVFKGTHTPLKQGATPNSIYIQKTADGRIKTISYYDELGNQYSYKDFFHLRGKHKIVIEGKRINLMNVPHEHRTILLRSPNGNIYKKRAIRLLDKFGDPISGWYDAVNGKFLAN